MSNTLKRFISLEKLLGGHWITIASISPTREEHRNGEMVHGGISNFRQIWRMKREDVPWEASAPSTRVHSILNNFWRLRSQSFGEPVLAWTNLSYLDPLEEFLLLQKRSAVFIILCPWGIIRAPSCHASASFDPSAAHSFFTV
jgi:hypothetical protein